MKQSTLLLGLGSVMTHGLLALLVLMYAGCSPSQVHSLASLCDTGTQAAYGACLMSQDYVSDETVKANIGTGCLAARDIALQWCARWQDETAGEKKLALSNEDQCDVFYSECLKQVAVETCQRAHGACRESVK